MVNHPNRKFLDTSDFVEHTDIMYPVTRKIKKGAFNLPLHEQMAPKQIAFEIDWDNKYISVFCWRGRTSLRELDGAVLTLGWKSPIIERNYGDHRFENQLEQIKAMQEDSLFAARKANQILENCEVVTEEIKFQVLQLMRSPEEQEKAAYNASSKVFTLN